MYMHVQALMRFAGFYLEKYFWGGSVLQNIIAYYTSTYCVGGLGEYPPGNF